MNEFEVMVEIKFKDEEPVVYTFDYSSTFFSMVSTELWADELAEDNHDTLIIRFLKENRGFDSKTDTIKRLDPVYINLGD